MPPTPANISELQLIANHTASDKIDLQSFELLPQNYSLLINKLEQLALGLDSAFANFTLDHRELDVTSFSGAAVAGAGSDATESELEELFGGVAVSAHTPPLLQRAESSFRSLTDAEYSRVVSDIWIGVILTLLIVSVIFFICSCFLYHRFQQWKNSYRTNPNEPVEICRHYTSDFEAESLPSYTIVSGLPTYDDALEEFRKAGIILAPAALPVIKIFESDTKDNQLYNLESGFNEPLSANTPTGTAAAGGDNISLSSTCTCGASNPQTPHNSTTSLRSALNMATSAGAQIIELSPEQLATLSRKRLSLQIAFNNPPPTHTYRRNSRPRIDLYRAANRNNLWRTYAAASHAAPVASNTAHDGILPPIHRSCSTTVICSNDGNSTSEHHPQQQHLQHRGSLF